MPIASWRWDFGDGTFSDQPNPTHRYTETGVYTVSLTVTTEFDMDSETKVAYLSVFRRRALDNYVRQFDSNFSFVLENTIKYQGATAYIIRMTCGSSASRWRPRSRG